MLFDTGRSICFRGGHRALRRRGEALAKIPTLLHAAVFLDVLPKGLLGFQF